MNKIDWSKSHCGVMLCTFDHTIELMPEVAPLLEDLVPHMECETDKYLVDVKVHMLMPGEWPCIPNWHRDFVPRDEDKKRLLHLVSGEEMYIWVSGEPYTEFAKPDDIKSVGDIGWKVFTQDDVHRGVESKIHTWRCFIRVIPKKFVHPSTLNVGTLRRHSQVYLDAAKFKW